MKASTDRKFWSQLGMQIALGAILASFQIPSQAGNQQAPPSYEQTSVMPVPVVSQVPNCPYVFEDTYYGTDSNATPPHVGSQGYGPNFAAGDYGTTLQLQFNNFGGTPSPTQLTPAVPCDGYYEVSFTVYIRNDTGTGCDMGENAMTIWSTSTDPQSPNAYGCPPGYVDINTNQVYASTNNHASSTVKACETFSQWVQCAWTNNFDYGQESNFGQFMYYGVQAFPIFSYTPIWGFQEYSNIHSQYPGMCYEPNGCWENPGQFNSSYQTAYCSLKPFHFKNKVYLHKGAQISAPALASQMIYTPYQVSEQGVINTCGFSVVGGKFKVVYMGPS